MSWRRSRTELYRAGADPVTGAALVHGAPPGPAGVAVLVLLAGRAELVVDVAEPNLLVSLRIDDPSAADAERAARLILGPEASLRPGATWEPPFVSRTGGGLRLIGRLALALGEVSVPGLEDRAVAVGLVEAGVLAHDLRVDLSPEPTGTALARAGLDRWERLEPAAFDDLALDRLDALDRRSRRWTKILHAIDPSLADRFEPLARALRATEPWRPAAAAGGARPATPASTVDALAAPGGPVVSAAAALSSVRAVRRMEAPPARRRSDVEVVFHPTLAAAGARVIASELDDHHLTVHVGGLPGDDGDVSSGRHTGGTWLRVFTDVRRPTLVALVPFDSGGARWRTAVALIPPRLSSHDLLVDVTRVPEEPWRSKATQALRTATHLGATAARASRLGDAEAPDGWQRAADAWHQVGDDGRAAIAEAYIEDPPRSEPFATDLLS